MGDLGEEMETTQIPEPEFEPARPEPTPEPAPEREPEPAREPAPAPKKEPVPA